MDFLSQRVFSGWLKCGRWSKGSRGALWTEFRPPGYPRLYIITPQRSFAALRLACLLNPAGECTLIRPGAANNGPCVPLSVVGGAEVTSRPQHVRDVSKGHKSSKRGEREERPEADRRTGKGLLKLQTDLRMSQNLYLSRRFHRITADTVTLRDKRRTDASSHKDKEDLKTLPNTKRQISTLLKSYGPFTFICCYCLNHFILSVMCPCWLKLDWWAVYCHNISSVKEKVEKVCKGE